jgi:hypothetical protein
MICYAHTRQGEKGTLLNIFVAVTYDCPIYVPRYDECERINCRSQDFLYVRGIEQAECHIQCLTVASIGVVVHFSCVHDGAHSQLSL